MKPKFFNVLFPAAYCNAVSYLVENKLKCMLKSRVKGEENF